MKFIFTASSNFGNFNHKIIIETSDITIPAASIWLRGKITGDIVVEENNISLYYNKDKIMPKIIHIKSLTNKNFKIMEVKDSNNIVKTKIRKITAKQWEVDLSLNSKPKQRSGKLILKTSSKTQPEITVSYWIRSNTRFNKSPVLKNKLPFIKKPKKFNDKKLLNKKIK